MTQLQPDNNRKQNLYQVDSLGSFKNNLAQHGLQLARGKCTTLQVNVGLLCNQSCLHCHLDAGPSRKEIMSEQTVAEVMKLATRFRFEIIDITGGAPEMNPHIEKLVSSLSSLTHNLILRSNLTAIAAERQNRLLEILTEKKVTIIASLPSLNEVQSDAQRGKNSFATSINALRKLNSLGYGLPGSNLELNLVSNPVGAFLPPKQEQVENRFRQMLARKWDISFNSLYTFANVPLGRFLLWLETSGNLENYILKLASNFNSCTLQGLMCRSLISVSWDGYLFDCDFNQSLELYMGGKKKHISELHDMPGPGETIAVSEHCYTCTAGSGFT
ncbi:MAG: arsenosugar biosynthesis radical SAM protein ArsS [Deltaproteobacteria bacterium]|jgi:radical SAM/Cys-rich protein|nr:arsenosugar biosynthesis radical SAM protein ArsS [Deltaproteobacteria bacterium]